MIRRPFEIQQQPTVGKVSVVILFNKSSQKKSWIVESRKSGLDKQETRHKASHLRFSFAMSFLTTLPPTSQRKDIAFLAFFTFLQ